MNITIDAAMRRRVVWASTIGNALEWFDFTVFGLFAGTIGKQFFPNADPAASLLDAYGLLAVAYFARPLGGLFFGVWADRVGRKRALIAIVLSMAAGTFSIGLLPTFAITGVWAPALLLAARLVQGFSAGGEFGASTTLLYEFSPRRHSGFVASFQFVAQAIAFLVGAACAYVVSQTMTPEAALVWGWRLPFLAGLIIAPVGFYLRTKIDETPAFQAFLTEQAGVPNTPLRDAFAHHPRPLLALFFMIAGLTAFTSVANIFLTNFISGELRLQLADAQLGIFGANLAGCVLLPTAAALSDKFGRRGVVAPAIVVFTCLYLYFGHYLVTAPSQAALWRLQAAGVTFFFITGPYAALAVESFPVHVRSTGANVMYNVGIALFGGLAPIITGAMVHASGDRFAPFYYLAACMALSLVGLAILPKPHNQGLNT
jgi:MHS family proline/betaine transporter-like MFS transporter